jgi:isocitrate dehydrogenase
MNLPELEFLLMKGEGIGGDFAKALLILLKGIKTIRFKVVPIHDFRLPDKDGLPGALDPEVVEIWKRVGVGMKGPTRTLEGIGPKSVNVELREKLDLYANIRPVSYINGANSPMKKPELLDVVIFRQNTQDVYMGIEGKPGSVEMDELLDFLRNKWRYDLSMFTKGDLVGGGIKLISKSASEEIMHAAIRYALKHGRKKIAVIHKGNIMKYTEGYFKTWGIDYALSNFRDHVYMKNETQFSYEEKKNRIYIETIIADDALSQMLINPTRLDVMVMMNLHGDLLSDAAAAQVGGVPTAAGANIGNDYAMFEAIGGTADDIADQDKANPTAFLLAFAMLLDYKGFETEASAIREAISYLFQLKIGTGDMHFPAETTYSTSEFAGFVSSQVEKIMEKQFAGAH